MSRRQKKWERDNQVNDVLTKEEFQSARTELEKSAEINKNKALWLFNLKDGGTAQAFFTDEEIEDLKKQYPEVNWID
jgi:recombinational DNA repair protein RecT